MDTATHTDTQQKADKLVSAYINLRNAIQEKEEEVKSLKETQEQIASALLELCNEQNLDGMRTPFGTVSRSVRTTFWTTDWHSMHQFIKEHDAMHLLEKRIHNTHMKEFLDANQGLMPEGLQVDRKYVVSVRKPNAK